MKLELIIERPDGTTYPQLLDCGLKEPERAVQDFQNKTLGNPWDYKTINGKVVKYLRNDVYLVATWSVVE